MKAKKHFSFKEKFIQSTIQFCNLSLLIFFHIVFLQTCFIVLQCVAFACFIYKILNSYKNNVWWSCNKCSHPESFCFNAFQLQVTRHTVKVWYNMQFQRKEKRNSIENTVTSPQTLAVSFPCLRVPQITLYICSGIMNPSLDHCVILFSSQK